MNHGVERRPFFSSPRERQLWWATLLIVVAIYATLARAPVWLEWMRHQGMLAGLFFVCMVLVGMVIVSDGLKVRAVGTGLGVALGILAVYVMLFVRLATPERSHLIEYGVVSVFVYKALIERARQGRRVPFPGLIAALTGSAIGVVDECIQWVLPNRVFELRDIGFNVLAATMAIVAMAVLRRARRG